METSLSNEASNDDFKSYCPGAITTVEQDERYSGKYPPCHLRFITLCGIPIIFSTMSNHKLAMISCLLVMSCIKAILKTKLRNTAAKLNLDDWLSRPFMHLTVTGAS